MTEAEWFATNDPSALLGHRFGMRSPDSDPSDSRQLRYYFVACCRCAWDRLPWACRELVGVASKLGDGHPLDERLKSAATAAAEELIHNLDPADALIQAEGFLALANCARPADVPAGGNDFSPKNWSGIAHLVYYAVRPLAPIFSRVPEALHSAHLVREVFGNPFRETWFEPRWRTTTVRDLARGMYRSGVFNRMQILADALEDAGCTNDGVLDHCRTGTGHVRGCWVLDGLLDANDRR
jgi:hypothetical protein